MLKKLRIQNFKLWKDTGPIDLKPITLFLGNNSSGKSSIGQFLMLLKKTVADPDPKAVFSLGGRDSAVELGSFKEMLFQHNTEEKIIFSYLWDFPEAPIMFPKISTSPIKKGTDYALSFEAKVGSIKVKEKYIPILESLEYKVLHKEDLQFAVGYRKKRKSNDKYEIFSKGKKEFGKYFELVKSGPVPIMLDKPMNFFGFPYKVAMLYSNNPILRVFNLAQSLFFGPFFYLGPLRTAPERLYLWRGGEPESVGHRGENTIAAILAREDRKISLWRNRKKMSLQGMIALQLKRMGLIDYLKVTPISKGRQEYEVQIHSKGSDTKVAIPDVGFGVSQVLPVLAQCFYAPMNSIILIEQPEIHLHPSAQSALADVMIDVIHSKEESATNGKKSFDRNIQLIIETHSEHFLLRLLRRIAEDKDKKDPLGEKVSVYFVEANTQPAKLEKLQIDKDGSVSNWPKDFFGDALGDAIGQAKAAAKI